MRELFKDSNLLDILDKVEKSERLSREDGIRLMDSNEILLIGYMADLVRKRKNGDKAYFIVNRHINHTNICENLCKFCAFGVKADAPGAYTMSLEEIEQKVMEHKDQEISEIHIVGGLNPDLSLDYFLEMMRRVRKILPNVVVQSFTAVEIDYFAKVGGVSAEDVLKRLKEAGLDSLPGGGAEIFAPRIREKLCEKKISGERWLEIHGIAHGLGMRTNATMLYGHIETTAERIDHMLQLRQLQDRTGGFLTFIPLAFHPQNTQLEEEMAKTKTTGYDDLKVLAVGRLMLDNFDHVKAFWIYIGPKLAQVSLSFGVDDLDGTVLEEKISHSAGANTGQFITKSELVKMIKAAGKIPIERDTLYNVIEEGF